MKYVVEIFMVAVMILCGLLISVLFAHIISLSFDGKWALDYDTKTASSVIGTFLGIFMAIAWCCRNITDD